LTPTNIKLASSIVSADFARLGEQVREATDIADYLTKKGLPFREAHGVVGDLVRYATEKGVGFDRLSLDEYRKFSPLFERDVLDTTVETSVAARNVPGGTAPEQVKQALAEARRRLEQQ